MAMPHDRSDKVEEIGLLQQGNPKSSQTRVENQDNFLIKAPTLELPKSGSIRGIGEKFTANLFTGSARISVPIDVPVGRSGFKPDLSLTYSSSAGNGLLGMGWSLQLPSITRKTERELPQYADSINSDTFILAGSEDLVPQTGAGSSVINALDEDGNRHVVTRYLPRVDQGFSLIEKWTRQDGDVHWRTISKENVTTIYGRMINGKDVNTRISDPSTPRNVFSWLVCEMRDGRGNLIRFQYKQEDEAGKSVNKSDTFPDRGNVHIKSILYGNREPDVYGIKTTANHHWYFRVVFDYGEHDLAQPSLTEVNPWAYRSDPSSSFRSGFCIRVRRRMSRVLCFSHFPAYTDSNGISHAAEEGGTMFLTSSTNFHFRPSTSASPYSLIEGISRHGYVWKADGTYLHEQMPPVEFEYSIPHVKSVPEPTPLLENVPEGLNNVRFQLIDIDRTAVAGLLYEQGEAWLFKEGLGEKGFGKVHTLPVKPSPGNLQSVQLTDLQGQGKLSLVSYEEPGPGFHEHLDNGQWAAKKYFKRLPNLNWRDPNIQFVDLNGDGVNDILITTDEKFFTWYPSLGEDGFGEPRFWPKPADGTTQSSLVFADSDSSIFMADMNGDAMLDIVVVKGGLRYFPALGYARYGAARHIDNAPVFDKSGEFDPSHVTVADLNGDGCADLLYTGKKCCYWLNQSANRFGPEMVVNGFPQRTDYTRVQLADLKSTGTLCLVWSSSLPKDEKAPLKYTELMACDVKTWSVKDNAFKITEKVVKPFLLTAINNGLGGRTEVEYKPSTRYYLEDKEAGLVWQTKMPITLQLVSESRVIDLITSTVYGSTYKYHHGFLNHEKEVAGFACVEQYDVADYNQNNELDQPPVKTITWYHTGANPSLVNLESYFRRNEYYRGDVNAWFLPDTIFDNTIVAAEMREAARALKGSVLHQEVFASRKDPYTVLEKSYRVIKKQNRGPNKHAVFSLQELETISYNYEQDPRAVKDPRIAHTINLTFDQYNNVLASVALGYPRGANYRIAAYNEEQNTLQVIYTLNSFTSKPNPDSNYNTQGLAPGWRHSVLFETQQWEYCNKAAANLPLQASDFVAPSTLPSIKFYDGSGNAACKRLISHTKHTFYDNNGVALPLGQVDYLALPFESYRLAFTADMLTDALGNYFDVALKADLVNKQVGGYILKGNDYWRSSGYQRFDATNFYHPSVFFDPFGNQTTINKYWHNLIAAKVTDAAGNVTEINLVDPYSLQPKKITDLNDNVDEIAFDVLGQVAGSVRSGRQFNPATGTYVVRGFSLTNFNPYLTLSTNAAQPAGEIDDLINNDPLSNRVINYLKQTGSRYFLDYWRFKREGKPVAIVTATREDFATDNPLTTAANIRTTVSYQDGLGRTIVTKLHVEDDIARPGVTRWLGSGLCLFNNKGKQIQQFENYHTATHQWDPANEMQVGVSNTFYYDPLGRVEKIKYADGSLSRSTFGPWGQSEYDQNDTVLDAGCTWYSDRGSPNPNDQTIRTSANQQLRAAWLAAQHANTPRETILDNLGRSFIVIENNGGGKLLATRSRLDFVGNVQSITNPMQFTVMESKFSYLQEPLRNHSIDSGDKRQLNNVAGNPFISWDGKGSRVRMRYDPMQRLLSRWLMPNGGNDKCIEYNIYGDRVGVGNATDNNLRGAAFIALDQSGAAEMVSMDVWGKPLVGNKQLVPFKAGLQYAVANPQIDMLTDWSQAEAVNPSLPTGIVTIRGIMDNILASETYEVTSVYNAIGENINAKYRYFDKKTGKTDTVGAQVNSFNSQGKLVSVDTIDFQGNQSPAISKITYNPRGQRDSIRYGNSAITKHLYDPKSFRLSNLTTKSGQTTIQDLTYTYDAIGNATSIVDAAQQSIFFNNRLVNASNNYEYDASYRLTFSSGREHLGLTNNVLNPAAAPKPFDGLRTNLPLPAEGNALGRYYERYTYDDSGNITLLEHFPENQIASVWNREYHYQDQSPINQAHFSNRLTYTKVGNQRDNYNHDANGNMSAMQHLQVVSWNLADQLQATARQSVNAGVPQTTYYQYDGSGQRTRKITFSQGTTAAQIVPIDETIYAGPFEIFRRFDNANQLCRLTCHVMDDKTRVALIETKTLGSNNNDGPLNQPMIRYQLGNHLGSVSIELDDQSKVISYEEYFSWGEVSFQSVDQGVKRAAKRFKYVAKELDNENALYYYGARYYLSIGRWISCDPSLSDGFNLYEFVRNNPVKLVDPNGNEAEFAGSASIGITFGTHENRVFGKVELSGSYTFGHETFRPTIQGNFSLVTYPFVSRWGRFESNFRGWETDITLGGGAGVEPIAVINWSSNWRAAKSFSEFGNPAFTTPTGDVLSKTDQRLGVLDVSFGYKNSWNFTFSTYNDTKLVGGDSGDSYRSAGGTLTLGVPDDFASRFSLGKNVKLGLGLDLVTGYVDNISRDSDNVDLTTGDPFGTYIMHGPFQDLSQGSMYLFMSGENWMGVDDISAKALKYELQLGWDSDNIRNAFQNLLIHKNLDTPYVPFDPERSRLHFQFTGDYGGVFDTEQKK